jgi:selenide,water dikinase
MEMIYKLTQYSHGAGCGCKISPATLDKILAGSVKNNFNSALLVGNEERDDAAVLDLGDGTALISTTDFFMPIVDNPFDFGRIAAVNAISDVYAMGGTPILAIAILGWPIDKLPPEVAGKVIDGAKEVCKLAGIPLAGGHSIDSPEPIFGLAVNGRVRKENLKKNGGAKTGDFLFLTKGIGVGILTTAQKKDLLLSEHANIALESMTKLNIFGEKVGALSYVHALTDVTGFGLAGHLTEMMEASNTSAVIEFDAIPILNKEIIKYYLEKGCIPGGTNRNYASYGHKMEVSADSQLNILCDPQTSGGLLIAVGKLHVDEFILFANENGFQYLKPIGTVIDEQIKRVRVF